MRALVQKWSSTNRFIGLALVILSLLFGTAPMHAQPSPPNRPILFVHGWCGSAYDWAPLLSSLKLNTALSAIYPNKAEYIIEYDTNSDKYYYYQVSDQSGTPLLTGPIQLFSLYGQEPIGSDARFFAIRFYDPWSNGTDPANVSRISVLNKAYEIKKVVEKIKEITNPTGGVANATSVNIVAHSMGGLDVRAYVENLASAGSCYNYQDPNFNSQDPAWGSHPNYAASTCLPGTSQAAYANDVANIITVDTPHWGAPLAVLNVGLGQLADLTNYTCQAFSSTNKMELLQNLDGGPGLLEELNYIGSPNFGVTPSKNTVPIQAVANYTGYIGGNSPFKSWLGITGYSDEIVPLDNQAVPALGPNSTVVLPAPAQFYHTGSDWEVLSNLDCWVFIPFPELMLHSMRCLGALSDPQKDIATQLISDNMLWINSWSVTSAISLGDPVTIKYSAADLGSTTLSSVTLWRRAPDNNGQPGAWTNFDTQTLSGGTTAASTFTDNTITAAGTYYYVADMLDSANREARAPLVTTVTVSPVSTSGYTLTVNSTNPSSGVGITVSPADNNALGNGTTSFVRTYNRNTQVTLTAPSTASGNSFSSWTGCDSATSTTCTVTLAASRTVTANYNTTTSPTLTAHFSYAQRTLYSGSSNPFAVDASGNVFVADNSTMKEILASGGYTTVKTLGSSFSGLNGIAVDGSENVFVTDTSNTVKEILAAGGYTTVNTVGSGFNYPSGVTVDGSGNVFVADSGSAVKEIVAVGGRVTSTSTVNTVGSGFASLKGIAADSVGNVFVADYARGAVKEILAAGGYTTVKTLSNSFTCPWGVAVDGSGNVFVGDNCNGTVKEILAAGGYTTVKTLSSGSNPNVAVDGSGNVFVAGNNSVVELVTGTANFGTVSIGQTSGTFSFTFTFDTAGTLGSFAALTGGVTGLDFATANTGTCAANTAYAAGATCTVNVTFTPTLTGLRDGTVVLKDGSGNVIAAANVYGTGWIGSSTAPTEPVGTASGTQTATILFSNSFTLGSISVVTQGATGLDFNYASGGTCTAGAAYTSGQMCTVNFTFTPIAPGQRMGAIVIADGSGNVQATEYISGMGTGPEAVFAPGIISTVAGAASGNITVDSAGNIFFVDPNNRIRKVSASTGLISTVAGNGSYGYNGDGIAATSAELNYPSNITVDSAGNLYFADNVNERIRKVNASTGLISTVAGNGYSGTCCGGYNGDGIAATNAELCLPSGVALDGTGNIYITDTCNGRIREVSASTGLISTVAGNGTLGYNGDGIAATSAELYDPGNIIIDSTGNIFFADFLNNRIRKVSASTGLISTVAGNGTQGYNGDGIAATSAELIQISGVALDSAGNIYIADAGDNRIRKVSASTGLISTVAGYGPVNSVNAHGGYNGDGIAATSAELNLPSGVAVDSAGNIYIADNNNARIRKVSSSTSGLSFATTNVSSTSSDSPQTVTLWNNGNTALTLPIPSSGNNPSIATNFTLNSTGGTACPLIGSTSSSAGTLATGASCTLPISFAPTAAGTISGSLVVTDNSMNGTNVKQTVSLGGTATSTSQTITFTPPSSPVTYGVSPISLSASASSGLAVTFSVLSGPGTVSGSTLTVTGVGTIVVAANQAGNSNYTAATQVTQSMVVNLASPTITFTVPNHTYGDAAFTVSATSNSSGAITYSVVSGPATISGSTVTLTGAGTVVLQASQAAVGNYTSGTQNATFTVAGNAPTISFTVPNHTYGDAPFTVAATSNSSGAITYSVVSGPATISGSTVTLTGAGSVVLQASQVAAGNYTAGTQTATVTVAKESQTITFSAPASPVNYGVAPISLSVSASSGLAVAFNVVSGPGTISGSTLTITGAGTVVVAANQAGNTNYAAATQVTQSLVVNTASQTISFTAPTSPVTYGVSPITLVATGGASGNAVVYSVVSGPATISGSTLTITGAGTVVVAANQAGNANYATATQVTQSITVNQASQTISFTQPTSPVTYGVSPITLSASSTSGLAVTFSVVSGPGTVSGSTLTITGVGTVVVAANQAGNANYAAATQVTQSIVVNVIGVAATPTFSPVAGTYTAAQTVTISDATSGATIYYTTNGTTPTTSSPVYSGAITVLSTETLEAIATATGYSTSAVATAAYTISIPTNPQPVISGVSPAFTNAGGAVLPLTVNGSGFIASSTVYWGASALTTTYVSATQLTAQVPAADTAAAGTNAITVQNPAPGGGTSNAWQFEVDSASSGSTAPTITSTTETVTAGSTASYPVTMPSVVTSVSVTCLNLPTGASCSYSSTTNTVTIATSSTTPKGTYQIIVVFTETVSGAASGFILLPILLLPLGFIRRKLAARGIWLTACLGLVLMATAALSIGCGSGGGSGSGSTTPPATHQVTSSGAVSLTIQ
jgi:hypothetical protein